MGFGSAAVYLVGLVLTVHETLVVLKHARLVAHEVVVHRTTSCLVEVRTDFSRLGTENQMVFVARDEGVFRRVNPIVVEGSKVLLFLADLGVLQSLYAVRLGGEVALEVSRFLNLVLGLILILKVFELSD